MILCSASYFIFFSFWTGGNLLAKDQKLCGHIWKCQRIKLPPRDNLACWGSDWTDFSANLWFPGSFLRPPSVIICDQLTYLWMVFLSLFHQTGAKGKQVGYRDVKGYFKQNVFWTVKSPWQNFSLFSYPPSSSSSWMQPLLPLFYNCYRHLIH